MVQIPFVKRAPLVTFRKPIGSISVSGHKFIGAPMPCGVVITRQRYIAALSQDVEYLNSRDATIMGSRNGHAPIYMWYTLTRKGYAGMRKDVERCLRNAHLLKVYACPFPLIPPEACLNVAALPTLPPPSCMRCVVASCKPRQPAAQAQAGHSTLLS